MREQTKRSLKKLIAGYQLFILPFFVCMSLMSEEEFTVEHGVIFLMMFMFAEHVLSFDLRLFSDYVDRLSSTHRNNLGFFDQRARYFIQEHSMGYSLEELKNESRELADYISNHHSFISAITEKALRAANVNWIDAINAINDTFGVINNVQRVRI